jgi:hypothetical protein
VVAVAVGVALAVYCLSWTHALLPHEHETICDISGATKTHFLSYITPHEKMVLIHYYGGRGTASKGLMGTQGVPCFPKRQREEPGAPPRSRARNSIHQSAGCFCLNRKMDRAAFIPEYGHLL